MYPVLKCKGFVLGWLVSGGWWSRRFVERIIFGEVRRYFLSWPPSDRAMQKSRVESSQLSRVKKAAASKLQRNILVGTSY